MTQWKPADAQSWAMTEKMLKADHDQNSAKFLVFLNFWLNTAEKMMTDPPDLVGPIGPGVYPPSPANAIRKALEVAEQQLGFIDVYFMGQLLACIGTYWCHGDELCSEMSVIELKITGEALRIKMDDLGIQAMEETGEPIRTGPQGGPVSPVEDAQQAIDPLTAPDRRPGGAEAVPDPGADPRGRVGTTSSPGPEERGASAVRNRLGERPPRKGGKPLDRRPSRPTLRGE